MSDTEDTTTQPDEATQLTGEPHAIPPVPDEDPLGDPAQPVAPDAPAESEPAGEPEHEQQPEQPDEQEQPDVHGTPAATARALSEKEIEKINRNLEGEARRHASRVLDIMGDDANVLVQCPLCLPLIPGFRYPQPPEAEQLAAVKEAIGEPAELPLRDDPELKPCETCDGFGATKTPSKVVGHGKRICPRCKGIGYLSPTGEPVGNGSVTATDGPVVATYTHPMPDAPEPPEVTALKSLGYIVVPPPRTVTV